MSDVRRMLDGVQQQFPPPSSSSSSVDGVRRGGYGEAGGGGGGYHPPVPEDVEDFRVLRYGSDCVLKSRQVSQSSTACPSSQFIAIEKQCTTK